MAIKIKGQTPAQDTASAHDEAAAEIETEVATKSTKKDGSTEEILNETHEHEAVPVNIPGPFERIEVGTSFKMPVADYTMLEFSVRRSVPYDPATTDADEVFTEVKGWVEGKLNSMIEEQQEG